MTQDGTPVIESASEEEIASRVAEAAKAATAAKELASSSGKDSDEVENLKMFTTDDMMKALAEQKLKLEADFAKEKASGSASQTPSGSAQRPPQEAFVYPGSEPPRQRGGPYQWEYPTPKLV